MTIELTHEEQIELEQISLEEFEAELNRLVTSNK